MMNYSIKMRIQGDFYETYPAKNREEAVKMATEDVQGRFFGGLEDITGEIVGINESLIPMDELHDVIESEKLEQAGAMSIRINPSDILSEESYSKIKAMEKYIDSLNITDEFKGITHEALNDLIDTLIHNCLDGAVRSIMAQMDPDDMD